jgi:hypothetical protein
MRKRSPLVALLLAGALFTAGCASEKQEQVSAAPTLDELPNLSREDRVLPIKIGIDDRYATRAPRIVPEFKPVEPTPEERAILGPEPEPEIDFLALYQPPPSPQRGIDPLSRSGGTIGVGGKGGPDTALEPVRNIYGTNLDRGGGVRGVDNLTRIPWTMNLLMPPNMYGIGMDSKIRVGVGGERKIAGKHDRVD